MMLVAASAAAQVPPPQASYLKQAKRIANSAAFARAREILSRDYDRTVSDLIHLTEIPAPPFEEKERGKAFMEMLRAHGLTDIEMDAEGNVMGLRKGSGKGGLLVVTAHLDTVFPAATNVKVRRENNRLYAPGIGDDTTGLTAILAMVRALDGAGIRTGRDILFMGNVGEEGPGNLRGMRHFFGKGKYRERTAMFVSLEPGQSRITNQGVGSLRYEVTFKGPGGHSWIDFGLVNPAHAMGNAIVAIGQMKVPSQPKTSFNVGIVSGGTSVNSIPFSTSMLLDLRSEGAKELKAAEADFLALLPTAVAAENRARSTAKGAISVETKLTGDRPVGNVAPSAPIIQTALAAVSVMGEELRLSSASTDSNIPMSLGIPAVTLGSGFSSERVHSLEESVADDRDATVRHMAISLATIIALADGSRF